jgi:hypothetical protein
MFLVLRPAQPAVQLCLVAARALSNPKGAGESCGNPAWEHRFSLLFRGPGEAPLKQDTYTFEHQSLGPMVMFIVPVLAREKSHQYYEAIFNRHPGPIV